MSKPITVHDAEITIVGCIFVVDYNYYEEIPADSLNPFNPADVEIVRVEIKNQPNGDADELLEAIKVGYENGYELLHQTILGIHQ